MDRELPGECTALPSETPTSSEIPTSGPAGPDRRTVLRGAATLGVLGATGVLAGCGGGSESAAESAGPGTVLGPVSKVPSGGGKVYRDAKIVVTQPSMGEYKAFSAICTHEKCVVAGVSDTIDCSCHGSKYSVQDGSVVSPPAVKPLAEVAVTVTDGNITLA